MRAALTALLILTLASVYAFAAGEHPKRVVIDFYNSDGTKAFFHGSLHIEARGKWGMKEWTDLWISGGHVASGVSGIPSSVLRCMLDMNCLASATLNIYVEPGDMFPVTLQYKLKELNASIAKKLVGNTLYINITLPMKLNTARVCVYTMKHAPVPGAEVRSDGGTRKTGQNGCTGKPILISSAHKLAVVWGGKLWPIQVKDEYFKTRRVNITLPVPWDEKFNLTIVSKDGKPLVVFVQYPGPNFPKLCNGTCSFTLNDVGSAGIFFQGIYTTLTLDKIVNGTFFVLNVKAKPLRLCVYSDNGTPLEFGLDIRASYALSFIITGDGQLNGRGCGTFYFPSIPEQIRAWASYWRGKYHLAKPFKVNVPGNQTLHLDITPPKIARVWMNASWTTLYGTKCLDTLLYVQAYDPNKWASGVKEVRAGFSKDFYDLMKGDYLGNNTWRIELDCPRHTGAIRTLYVAALDKSGNRATLNLTYRVEPGVKWLVGEPLQQQRKTANTQGSSGTAANTLTTSKAAETSTALREAGATATPAGHSGKAGNTGLILATAIIAILITAFLLLSRRNK